MTVESNCKGCHEVLRRARKTLKSGLLRFLGESNFTTDLGINP